MSISKRNSELQEIREEMDRVFGKYHFIFEHYGWPSFYSNYKYIIQKYGDYDNIPNNIIEKKFIHMLWLVNRNIEKIEEMVENDLGELENLRYIIPEFIDKIKKVEE